MKTRHLEWVGFLFTALTAVLATGFTTSAQTSSISELQLYAGLTITNPIGTYDIEYNTDLSKPNNWLVLTNIALPTTPYLFIDTSASANSGKRFYRLTIPALTNPDPTKLIPLFPGTFAMGEPPNTVPVTFKKQIFMSKNLVTQGEYEDVMSYNPSENEGNSGLPVERLSWFAARDYCQALTTREHLANRLPSGWAYRLPTEAEWEYACRAGTTTRYSFGEDPGGTLIGDYAWYSANSLTTTHRVQTRQPNPWGFYDMHGNVHQWCSDNGGSSSFRIWRGGSFDSGPENCTSFSRGSEMASSAANNIGFRVVAAPVQP